MRIAIEMQQLGPDLESAIIVGWEIAIGDAVEPGDVICEVETDKITTDLVALDGGVLVDFGEIKAQVAEIMKLLDHRYLNELPYFGDQRQPSSENIAYFVASELIKRIDRPGLKVSRVAAWESDDACATYIVDDD